MSASALKTLADNHSHDKTWDIPVVVRECSDPSKQPVPSQTADRLAVNNQDVIVMSASALETLADNHSHDKTWDIPLIVQECTDPCKQPVPSQTTIYLVIDVEEFGILDISI